MVDLAGDGVGAAQADALDEHAVGHLKLNESVGLDADISHGLGLCSSAGKAVQKPALGLHLRFAKLGLHHADDDRVGHEGTLGHVLLGFLAEGSAGLDLLAQNVAGADVHNAVLLHDELALGAFARAGGAGNDDLGRILLGGGSGELLLLVHEVRRSCSNTGSDNSGAAKAKRRLTRCAGGECARALGASGAQESQASDVEDVSSRAHDGTRSLT